MLLNKCQVFTSELFSELLLDIVGYTGIQILGKNFLENSCGEGNILKIAIERYLKIATEQGLSKEVIKSSLEKNFTGFEIDDEVKTKCISNLDIVSERYGITNVQWDIKNKDYLKDSSNKKFDYIVGNPPYMMYQSIQENEREYLRENFDSCLKGKFDYCYPFIEKSLYDLDLNSGKMAYLIPTSIFKNVFGEELRDIMLPKIKHIYDYKESKVFDNALVAASIIYFDNHADTSEITYFDIDNRCTKIISKEKLNNKKWIFNSNSKIITNPNLKLSSLCKISNSVATLLNEAFIIKDFVIDGDFYVNKNGFYIEKNSVLNAYSPRNLKYDINEKIIFPYKDDGNQLIKYSEEEFKKIFPCTYMYLLDHKENLLKRKSDKNSKWFEYGRSQALNVVGQEKLLLSSVVTNEVTLYKIPKNSVPYSGFYITSDNVDLEIISKIMKSTEFYNYIQDVGINASGNSLRFSVRDFLNFPLELLSEEIYKEIVMYI